LQRNLSEASTQIPLLTSEGKGQLEQLWSASHTERYPLHVTADLKGFADTGQPRLCLHPSSAKNTKQRQRSSILNIFFPTRKAFSPQRQQIQVFGQQTCPSQMGGIF